MEELPNGAPAGTEQAPISLEIAVFYGKMSALDQFEPGFADALQSDEFLDGER